MFSGILKIPIVSVCNYCLPFHSNIETQVRITRIKDKELDKDIKNEQSYCSTFLYIFIHFIAFFGTFFTFRVFFAYDANGEGACHSQEQLKPCGMLEPGFWILTKGVKRQSVWGQPPPNST